MAKQVKDSEILELARGLQNTPWCDEFEKMISVMLYNPNTPRLLQGRHWARCQVYNFNNIDPNSADYETITKKRFEMLQGFLGGIGEGSYIETPVLFDYGCNVIFGKSCFVNMGLKVLDTSLVLVGDRVQIGPGVSLLTAGHETSILSRIKYVEYGLLIRIEDDCWIGANAVIFPGVTIGNGSTIGAGSVVNRSIPPHSIAVGIPAKVIKKVQTLEEELTDPNNPYRHLPDPH